MKKRSAGVLLYKQTTQGMQVFIGHPGGPYWAKKDNGAWSIPKGEFEEGEDAFEAAKREFKEEVGGDVPAGEPIELGDFKVTSGKIVTAWALEADFDPEKVSSNLFEIEWPPKSGQKQEFPEIDKAGWFTLSKATIKLVKGQVQIIEKLAELLGVSLQEEPFKPAKPKKAPITNQGQTSLF